MVRLLIEYAFIAGSSPIDKKSRINKIKRSKPKFEINFQNSPADPGVLIHNPATLYSAIAVIIARSLPENCSATINKLWMPNTMMCYQSILPGGSEHNFRKFQFGDRFIILPAYPLLEAC